MQTRVRRLAKAIAISTALELAGLLATSGGVAPPLASKGSPIAGGKADISAAASRSAVPVTHTVDLAAAHAAASVARAAGGSSLAGVGLAMPGSAASVTAATASGGNALGPAASAGSVSSSVNQINGPAPASPVAPGPSGGGPASEPGGSTSSGVVPAQSDPTVGSTIVTTVDTVVAAAPAAAQPALAPAQAVVEQTADTLPAIPVPDPVAAAGSTVDTVSSAVDSPTTADTADVPSGVLPPPPPGAGGS